MLSQPTVKCPTPLCGKHTPWDTYKPYGASKIGKCPTVPRYRDGTMGQQARLGII